MNEDILQKARKCPKNWVLRSAGRALPLHGEGRGFDPLSTHHPFETDKVNNE